MQQAVLDVYEFGFGPAFGEQKAAQAGAGKGIIRASGDPL